MARAPIMAAGGIVLRQARPPLIAVVRLRKRDEWVLPKGKLDDGETPRDAAMREVLEETGHNVTLQEFLGTLAYQSGGRSKIVHYWRMRAIGEQAYELMTDIREVDWLPLDAALARLSRLYEREFLAHVGPVAVEAVVAELSRRKPAAKRKRAAKPAGAQSPVDAPAETAIALPPRQATTVADKPGVIEPATEPHPWPSTAETQALPTAELPKTAPELVVETAQPGAAIDPDRPMPVDTEASAGGIAVPDTATEPMPIDDESAETADARKGLSGMLRGWLRRAE